MNQLEELGLSFFFFSLLLADLFSTCPQLFVVSFYMQSLIFLSSGVKMSLSHLADEKTKALENHSILKLVSCQPEIYSEG